jgi:hypothetical protein
MTPVVFVVAGGDDPGYLENIFRPEAKDNRGQRPRLQEQRGRGTSAFAVLILAIWELC